MVKGHIKILKTLTK